MESIVLIGIGLGACAFVAWLRDQSDNYWRSRNAARAAEEAQLRAEYQRHINRVQKMRQHLRLARFLLSALEQLRRCPDFRRSASIANQCETLSATYRRSLFTRFRSAMVAHFALCLQRGVTAESLLMQLQSLITSLAVAPFEAEYIAREAQRRVPRATPHSAPSFAQQLQQHRREHEERIATIQSTVEDDELREQLIEAEQTRFRDVALQLQDPNQPDTARP
jgi:ferritin-like metal-binding protein YciE